MPRVRRNGCRSGVRAEHRISLRGRLFCHRRSEMRLREDLPDENKREVCEEIMKNMSDLFIGGIAVVWFFAYLAFLAVLRGWVLSCLWLWFIVPIFNLPQLSTVQAIGVSCVISFLTVHLSEMKDEDKKPSTERWVDGLLFNFFALGIGYVVHLFL